MVAHFALFINLKILSIFFVIFSHLKVGDTFDDLQGEENKLSAGILLQTATDVVKDTYRRIETLEFIKQDSVRTAPYEIGYMVFNINEKYTKMVDKYNTSIESKEKLYTMELVMYLEEIELHYWEIDHLCSMIHEVERKYAMNSSIYATYHELTSKEKTDIKKSQAADAEFLQKFSTKKRFHFDANAYKLTKLVRTTRKKPSSYWPIYYGWEVDYAAQCDLANIFNASIFTELSWSVKLLLLKDLLNRDDYQGPPPVPSPTVVIQPEDRNTERRVPGIESLVARRQDEEAVQRDPNEDDNNMRLKLFRLMYETVRDSDLKCKRAELIRTHYSNSSVFEIGYLMGDVMDKFNIMSDISMTLKRLFHDWKPIEHINAYEQISNQAIEINHLVDIMKGISKTAEDPPS